ncbi:suppressor APC domain containing 2 [Chamberlinius hualienensis]
MLSMMNQQQQQQQQNMFNHPSGIIQLEDLPSQFVSSMRTLFDIMDDNKTGCVKLSDIETRWREDESRLLPKGVIECLRKVTPPNGLLSFERFCVGLRICLLRNRHKGSNNNSSGDEKDVKTLSSTSGSTSNIPKKTVPSQTVTPLSVSRPIKLDDWSQNASPEPIKIPPSPSGSSNSSITVSSNSSHTYRNSGSVTATVRPTNISSQQRTVSMPLLGLVENVNNPNSGNLNHHGNNYRPLITSSTQSATNLGVSSLIGEYGRGGNGPGNVNAAANNNNGSGSNNNGRMYRSETRIANLGTGEILNTNRVAPNRRGIMTVLHNWHMGMLQDPQRSTTNKLNENKVNMLEKNDKNAPSGAAINENSSEYTTNDIESMSNPMKLNSSANKGSLRRREPRRHTLANGIDYNMLKRMKQLEQEKDVLLQGLEAVDKARGWYMQQVEAVQEKMKYIGQSTANMEYSTEAHQERLNFQMAQIFEVNQHLSLLVESSQRGYPLHMNLAVRQSAYFARSTQQIEDSAMVNQLKEQTVSLSNEVGQKNERILQLEREKAALVRELFQARAHSRRESDDNTLM